MKHRGVFARGNKLWIKVKPKADGPWQNWPTGMDVGQEAKAAALRASVMDRARAGEAVGILDAGAVTVRRWADKWLADRRSQVTDWKGDEGHVNVHLLPALGDMRLTEVRPRHLVALVEGLRKSGAAPRTVRNIYSTARSMFRDALIADLIPSSPCVLTKVQLGRIRDKNPEWRATAFYGRDELVTLISDDRIPQARSTLYAFLGLTGARYGEAAGLRWRHLDLDAEPLGRVLIATSYGRGQTKTGAERHVPVHPTLAAMLAEWKLAGWPGAFGRQTEADDLVFPVTPEAPRKGKKKAPGSMLDKNYIRRRLLDDLEVLGLRHRRGHDLRRTFQTLADEDGIDRSLRRLITHSPSQDVLDLYTTVQWERLCSAMRKLNVERRKPAKILELPAATCYRAVVQ